ncbi:haloacid dehalogenase superfamily, subfamily IA, variant 3 with third motif having DD or ED [Devosia sp. YR412]|uniref:HAD family hydrolase n=1 Tax=Devosia sp. YR412 TaxID=1881030 RepID=UPI0008B66DB0|nr:HAD-IA family hydrolase [Devosia sp. YR412]SEP83887.1 haloacid dehalogenase superfamily, subfamily IA, variant 3 with third motif having DD or ED [Devosia sp. YR412]
MILKPGAALLFDIDGTLADTDPIHLEAFNRTFEPYGHHFDKARFALELQGFANAATAARFVPHLSVEEGAEVLRGKETIFRELAATSIHAVPGLFELMDMADALGLPMAAVTNAPRANAELILDGLGIRSRFRAVVIGEELAHGKPHPLPYLEGLRLIGGDAVHAVAFEDSRTGIASATAAGIATVGIRTSLLHEDMIAAGAVLSVDGYDDPALHAFIESRVAEA